jgi:hypothetical protein
MFPCTKFNGAYLLDTSFDAAIIARCVQFGTVRVLVVFTVHPRPEWRLQRSRPLDI